GAADDRETPPRRRPDGLRDQARLPDPGVTGDDEDVALAAAHLLDDGPDPGDLRLAAHERRAGRGLGRQGALLPHRAHRPDVDPARLALDGQRGEPLVDGVRPDPFVRRLIDEELPLPGRTHEAGGEVDRVADHRVLATVIRPDLA